MRTLGIIAATVSLTVMLATPALPQAQGYETSVQPVRPTLDTVTKELESALKSNGRTPPPSKLPMTSQIVDVELSTLASDTAPKPQPVPQPQPNNPPPKPVPPPPPSPPPGPAPFLKRPSLEKYREGLEVFRRTLEDKADQNAVSKQDYATALAEYRRRIALYRDATKLLTEGHK